MTRTVITDGLKGRRPDLDQVLGRSHDIGGKKKKIISVTCATVTIMSAVGLFPFMPRRLTPGPLLPSRLGCLRSLVLLHGVT